MNVVGYCIMALYRRFRALMRVFSLTQKITVWGREGRNTGSLTYLDDVTEMKQLPRPCQASGGGLGLWEHDLEQVATK